MSDQKPDDLTRKLAAQAGVNIEPDPIPNDSPSMHDLVAEDLRKRKEFGLKKYGTPLQAWNGRDALLDAYDEILDLAVYIKQCIEERKKTHPYTDTKIHEMLEAYHEGVGSSGGDQKDVRHSREWRGSSGF